MKLKDYIKKINKLSEEHPEALEYEVITAKDDEGNGYNIVYNDLTIGHFDGERDGEFWYDEGEEYQEEANAVCLN